MRKAEQIRRLKEENARRGKICVWCAKFQPLYEFRPLESNPMEGLEDICDDCWDEAHGLNKAAPKTDYGNRAGVYFIQAGKSGPIKIGHADNVKKRMVQLQISNAQELRLLLVLPGDQKLERELHYQFGVFRIRGEWFKPDAALKSYIKDLRAQFP